MFTRRAVTALFALLSLLAVPAFGDEWLAAKLRGPVFTFVQGQWVQLARGDVVPDGQVVATQTAGHVTLVRGKESITLSPNTWIEIVDRDGQQFTTVKQAYGKIEVEAEVRNVQHFEVVNPYLAAVVKGTRFLVMAGEDSGKVKVRRGQVAVEDMVNHSTVEVPAGHWVMADGDAQLALDGKAGDPPGANGSGRVQGVANSGNSAGNGNGNNGNGVGNGGGNGHGNGGGNSGNGVGNGGGNNGNGNGNGGNGNNGNGGNGNNGNGGNGNNGNGNAGNG